MSMEEYIREAFEENYERLRLEGGHPVAPDVKEQALQQVLMYWEKLQEIATKVTETEVPLTLPGQQTPSGRQYTIQGVVDIVREHGETVMYDIKTHDADFVRGNLPLYEGQLNIYAYIWGTLRQHALDGAAIIATGQTEELKRAIRSGMPNRIDFAKDSWESVIGVSIDDKTVQGTIREFGEVVDKIEDRTFCPPPTERLKAPAADGQDIPFGTHVCRNCDARFSCNSFIEFANETYTGKARAACKFSWMASLLKKNMKSG